MEKLPLPENLQHPDHAPKDGTTILADFSWPFPVPAVWNEHEQQWAIASVNANLINGEWTDRYFENDYQDHENMIGWMPVPEIAGARKEAGLAAA